MNRAEFANWLATDKLSYNGKDTFTPEEKVEFLAMLEDNWAGPGVYSVQMEYGDYEVYRSYNTLQEVRDEMDEDGIEDYVAETFEEIESESREDREARFEKLMEQAKPLINPLKTSDDEGPGYYWGDFNNKDTHKDVLWGEGWFVVYISE